MLIVGSTSRWGEPLSGTERWLNAERAEITGQTSVYNTEPDRYRSNLHGAAMLSTLASKDLGLIPRVRPTLIKFTTDEGIESGLRTIVEHIYASATQETPVSHHSCTPFESSLIPA